MSHTASALPLAFGIPGGQLGTLLVALIAALVVVLVGKFVLNVAWKLLVLAVVVIGALWVVTTVLA
ncbi:hypothetical protein GCM10009037_07720 [Halarchaeum grantii]|uniref:Uncharacterized protein n=1 Tax=Halarchaeum grantii TaxID=1193105 RepID=A0A830F7C9_9EURY|nr:hypothetical protein [Halarchaeum grantii]GGL26554.1 hypothetical protein GCM10009037_07720 [Halarchaeum grantii]